MKISPQTRQDLVCAGLFLAMGVALTCFLHTGPASWLRQTCIWFWFEFCGLVFFMRPLFIDPGLDLTGSPKRARFHRIVFRMLGLFLLAMLPVLVFQYFLFRMPLRDYIFGIHVWLVVPALIGCGACALGFLFRHLSSRMGY